MNSGTYKKYAIIWGVIFLILSVIFSNFEGGFFKFLYWTSIVMVVLSALTFFKR